MEARQPTSLDDFLFDLRGYLVLKKAAEPDLLAALNRAVDALPPLEMVWAPVCQVASVPG